MELKVSCARFGRPPDKNKPQPRFPGVSATFDPAAALVVYTDILKKEKALLAEGLLMEERVSKAKMRTQRGLADPVVAVQKQLSDLLPGYASLGDFCQHFGYRRHPTSGSFVREDSSSTLSARIPEDAASPLLDAQPELLSSGSCGSWNAFHQGQRPPCLQCPPCPLCLQCHWREAAQRPPPLPECSLQWEMQSAKSADTRAARIIWVAVKAKEA
ncbi:unnamed protein product [Symbiodinium pilosum]|uniref:Uncharacterized protein n=1 Tax=Symbiodinium pilosum TaxID=2952 RepID=A0A812INI1_SYMPI|nr:unnamed protein product [Symbiodinium pilosum]